MILDKFFRTLKSLFETKPCVSDKKEASHGRTHATQLLIESNHKNNNKNIRLLKY